MSLATKESSEHQATSAAADIYAEIVKEAAAGRFRSVEILFLDPKIMTRVGVTPETLPKLGCWMEIRTDSPKWADLVVILRTESVGEADRTTGEVRWGLIFKGDGSEASKELYFGPYYGPQSDGIGVFGYVEKRPVSFSSTLPKKMTSLIQGLKC
jgi:hypothetical protein